MSERREKMMAGEDAYLLPRDKGPVRRFVRDMVDSRRNVLGLFMPAALGLIFIMLAVPSVTVQRLLSPAMLVLVVIMVIDGFILGRKVNKLVDEKFPDNTESGWKLGFYAASRASQLRRMRAPRPQVNRGDKVDLITACAFWCSAVSGRASRSGPRRRSPNRPAPGSRCATSPPARADDDADWAARIAAHRARRPAHWSTVETVDVATQLRSDAATPTLVDDIGGWLTAAMDRRDAWTGGSVAADVDDLIDAVDAFASPLALVSPRWA